MTVSAPILDGKCRYISIKFDRAIENQVINAMEIVGTEDNGPTSAPVSSLVVDICQTEDLTIVSPIVVRMVVLCVILLHYLAIFTMILFLI